MVHPDVYECNVDFQVNSGEATIVHILQGMCMCLIGGWALLSFSSLVLRPIHAAFPSLLDQTNISLEFFFLLTASLDY